MTRTARGGPSDARGGVTGGTGQFWALTRVSVLMSLYHMNIVQRRTGSGSKQRGAMSVLAVLAVVLMAYSGFICYQVGDAVRSYGFDWIVLMIGLLLATLFVLVMNVYSMGAVLFQSSDTDQLFAYPLAKWQIVSSKILGLTVQSWLFSVIFCLPAFGVYVYFAHPGPLFYLFGLIAMIVVPGVPVFVMGLIAYIVGLVAAGGSRVSSYISTLLTVALLVGLIVGVNTGVKHLKVDAVSSDAILHAFEKYYPPAGYLGAAMLRGSGTDLALGVVWNVVPFVLLCALLARSYASIRSRSTQVGKAKAGRISYSSATVFRAMLGKEFARLISSPMYLLNACVGGLVAIVFAALLGRMGGNTQGVIDLLKSVGLGMDQVMLAFFLIWLGIGNTTSASVSLEGRALWIVQSMPVPARTALRAKLLLDWCVFVPCMVVASVVTLFTVRPGATGFWTLLGGSVLFAMLCGLVGLVVNLHIHRFDAISDAQAVKNSANAMLAIGVNMAVAVVAVFCFWLINHFGHIAFLPYWCVFAGVMVVAIVVLYRYVMTKGVALFENLS